MSNAAEPFCFDLTVCVCAKIAVAAHVSVVVKSHSFKVEYTGDRVNNNVRVREAVSLIILVICKIVTAQTDKICKGIGSSYGYGNGFGNSSQHC